MPDLTTAQIEALAAALALPMTPDDLVEVTHRVNAYLEALGPLVDLPLDAVEPVPIIVPPPSSMEPMP